MLQSLPHCLLTCIISHVGSLPRKERFDTDRKDLLNLFLSSKQLNADMNIDRNWCIYNLLYSSFRKSLLLARDKEPSHGDIVHEVKRFARKKRVVGLDDLCFVKDQVEE